MKTTFTPRLALALALCGAVVPFAIVGCGGGNGALNADPTPTPMVPVGTALPELSFTFNSGQKARFFNGTVSPTGVVSAQITVTGAPTAPLQVPPGTYPTTGTLNPTTRDFTLTQGAGSSYRFSVSGKVPSTTQDGNFVFTAQNGATENGSIARGTVILPPTTGGGTTTAGTTTSGGTTAGTTTSGGTTAGSTTSGGTTAGTTTAGTTAGGTTQGGTTTGNNDPVVGRLTFAGGTGYNGLTTTITNGFTEAEYTQEKRSISGRVVAVQNNQTRNVFFTIQGPTVVAKGDTYPLGNPFPNAFGNVSYRETDKLFQSDSSSSGIGTGSIKVMDLSANSITLQINQTVVGTKGVQFPENARGTLTINGTVTLKITR